MSYYKNQTYDYLVKLLLIGDTGVGKSSLLLRFADDSFTPNFIPTIGIDFKIKMITINDVKYKLQLWDTAGQERFRTITTAYYRGAMGILVVYDVTNMKSFLNIKNWIDNIKRNAAKDVNMMLIGNKCDKDDERVVTYEMGKALADELNIKFFETSARANKNVYDSFHQLINDIASRLTINDMPYKPLNTNIVINQKQDNKSKQCCHL